MSDPRRATRFGGRTVLLLAIFAGLAGCDDGSELEAAIAAEDEPRVEVSPETRSHRDAVIASVAYSSPELASQTRQYYRALDAGPRSRAVREAGGPAHVRAQLRAAELFHFAHKLDGCVADAFATRTPEGQLRLLQRLAAGKHGAAMIADAKRYDADGYAFDLSGYGDRPNTLQRIAAAYDTLSVHWRSIGTQKGNDQAARVFAETMLHLAAASDGKCVPDPKLQSLLDSMPS